MTAVSDVTPYTTCNSALDFDWVEGIKTAISTNATKSTDTTLTYTLNDIFTDDALAKNTTYGNCYAARANLYVQYTCEQSEETIKTKHSQVSVISACAVFLACIYMIIIYAFKRLSKLKQIDWDI